MEFNFAFAETNILQVQEAFAENRITSEELVRLYLERIARYDKEGPAVNSVLEINPDAVQTAMALDYERSTLGISSNLHGIPILIKDNIETADKMHTSAGSLALKDAYAGRDAFIIKKLRRAGAIILGKTNMTEWANYMSDTMPAGYSSRGGQVLNPYGPKTLSPGGSSSGSGAAVTCNFCCAALGTETSGSIVDPSSILSIVGIKPTVGLVSRNGIIPAAYGQDTAGTMTRSVEDGALLLGAIAGYDCEDPITALCRDKSYSDYTRFLDKNGLSGIRIGVLRKNYFDDLTEEEVEIMENSLNILRGNGAVIIDDITLPNNNKESSKRINLYEFKRDINHYLSGLDAHLPVHSLSELIAYHKTCPETMLKFGQSYLEFAEQTSGSLKEADYILKGLNQRVSSRKAIEDILLEYKADVLVSPGDKAALIINMAGFPMVTVPAGIQKNGKCLGITFTAEAFSEPRLLKYAYAFEQHAQKRTPPPV
jgi:amidase